MANVAPYNLSGCSAVMYCSKNKRTSPSAIGPPHTVSVKQQSDKAVVYPYRQGLYVRLASNRGYMPLRRSAELGTVST
jgi:hypothetical protein